MITWSLALQRHAAARAPPSRKEGSQQGQQYLSYVHIFVDEGLKWGQKVIAKQQQTTDSKLKH